MKESYCNQIYAGWLAKIIGIRMGAPVEGWSSQKIRDVYKELSGYAVDYSRFAADDDSNGPIFFIRALEDSKKGADLTSEDVAEALLNYVPCEHGFFWWGGYGYSTEHTAYLNLQAGIPAPKSGSIQQNGKAVAEQIGGQIFIDSWGLVCPGNPDLAAKLAEKAAGVTHGGDGVYGGIFVAACISAAFDEKDIRKILEKGLSYIPANSGYAGIVHEIMDYHDRHPEDAAGCLEYIQKNHGYDKYPGNCHIIPNTAVMILALLYGNGDFTDTLNLCNRCGWDTDCNVGNIATIMGVREGLEAIEDRLRKPIGDFLACSSVVGSLNIQDIPYGACYLIKLAWELAGEPLPAPFDTVIRDGIDSCHFEFPGSTHAMEMRIGDGERGRPREAVLRNTDETAYTGNRSLKATAINMEPGEAAYLFKRTYLGPEDFHDSRYDPAFSPLIYPGQSLEGAVCFPEDTQGSLAALYVREAGSGIIHKGELVPLKSGSWMKLSMDIPAMEGVLLDEAGYVFVCDPAASSPRNVTAYVDDFRFGKKADYAVRFPEETMECWTPVHREVRQFTRLKGQFCLEDGMALLTCSDYGEAYTGRYDWDDYEMEVVIRPVAGEWHMAAFRVQGAMRSYQAGLTPKGSFGIYKKSRGGWKILRETAFPWKSGREYTIRIRVKGRMLAAGIEDVILQVADEENPYLTGCVGLAVREGSHMKCSGLRVRPITGEENRHP